MYLSYLSASLPILCPWPNAMSSSSYDSSICSGLVPFEIKSPSLLALSSSRMRCQLCGNLESLALGAGRRWQPFAGVNDAKALSFCRFSHWTNISPIEVLESSCEASQLPESWAEKSGGGTDVLSPLALVRGTVNFIKCNSQASPRPSRTLRTFV
jgi:hypothetical protein